MSAIGTAIADEATMAARLAEAQLVYSLPAPDRVRLMSLEEREQLSGIPDPLRRPLAIVRVAGRADLDSWADHLGLPAVRTGVDVYPDYLARHTTARGTWLGWAVSIVHSEYETTAASASARGIVRRHHAGVPL